MRIETGFNFHDDVTDNQPRMMGADLTPDWDDVGDVRGTEDRLASEYVVLLSGLASDVAGSRLDGDTASQLLSLSALMHAANQLFELMGAILASQTVTDDGRLPAWVPATLGCADQAEYLRLMPDADILIDARGRAKRCGRPVVVRLEDARLTVRVMPDGTVRQEQEVASDG